MKILVVIGNPVTGFSYYGPFNYREEAKLWAKEHVSQNETYILANLYKP